MAFGGPGIGRHEGMVVFVPGGFPGDVLAVTVTRTRKRYAEARLDSILAPSPDRVPGVCTHAGSCGGCSWQSLRYEAQLRHKQEQVGDVLRRLGGLENFELRPILRMNDPYRYRNKVEFSVGQKDGLLVVGFHPPGRWDEVEHQTECALVPRVTEGIRATVEQWLRREGLPPWNARTQTGEVRHLTVREAFATGQVLVSLVMSSPRFAAAESLVEVILAKHPEVVGVLHAVNTQPSEVASGLPYRVLWGTASIREKLDWLELKISIDAFFQTNTRQALELYRTIEGEAALTGNETVWDLYSGIGSIGLFLSRSARAVLGIEVVPAAVADARENASLNGVSSVTFLEGNVRPLLKEILESKRALPEGLSRPDVVVLDPPRGGLAKKVIARVAESRPGRVVYVSCNPSSMASDLSLFAEHGYLLRRVTPVDMFPHTPHVEAVGLLEPADRS